MEGKNNNTPINITLTAKKGKVRKVKLQSFLLNK